MDADTGVDKEPEHKIGWYWFLLSALLVIAMAALAVVFREELRNLSQYGYLGAFVISVLSGGTVIVYVPGIPVIFTLGGILQYPFLVGIAAGLGEALGAFSFYLGGRGGHSFLENKNLKGYSRVKSWMTKRGSLTLFLASAIPNPVFSLIGATAGAVRLPPWKYYLACAAGKIIKGTYVAYLGAWGLGYILKWFGIELPT